MTDLFGVGRLQRFRRVGHAILGAIFIGVVGTSAGLAQTTTRPTPTRTELASPDFVRRLNICADRHLRYSGPARDDPAAERERHLDAVGANGPVISVVVDGVDNGRHNARVAINRPGETDYLANTPVALRPGHPFYFGGQRHGEGVLVIAIELGAAVAG